MSQADLNQLLVFAKVVEHGSFIAASRALGLPKTTVSRKVQELEERLGARLLQRTTRRVALTEAGAIYHEYCSRIVQDIADADLAVGRVHSAPRGELRVSASFSFGMSSAVISRALRASRPSGWRRWAPAWWTPTGWRTR